MPLCTHVDTLYLTWYLYRLLCFYECSQPILILWDIHIEEQYQGKGLGKHMLMLMELIAKKENMKMVSIPVQLNDEDTLGWVQNGAKGYAPDTSLKDLVGFDADLEGFEVFTKVFGASAAAGVPSAMITPTKPKKIEVQVDSPQGVADAIPEPDLSIDYSEGDKEELTVNDVDLQEHDIINGLKAMHFEKSNREATEEECQQWLEVIRSAKAEFSETAEEDLPAPPSSPASEEELIDSCTQAKINKATYNC